MIRTALLSIGLASVTVTANAGGVVTVAMTAGEIPIDTGTPDQGFEGYRFVALNLYDALVNWDLSRSDRASAWHIRSFPRRCSEPALASYTRAQLTAARPELPRPAILWAPPPFPASRS